MTNQRVRRYNDRNNEYAAAKHAMAMSYIAGGLILLLSILIPVLAYIMVTGVNN